MHFAALEYLYLLWILPAMVLLAIYSFRKKDRLLRLFADTELWDRLMPHPYRRRQGIKFVLLLAGTCLLLTALLRPRWGFHWEEITRKGVDIILAVDVSESMLAEDIKPNRLERAKWEITDLADMLQGDRVGLIAFAGAAFLQCPLTLDYGAFKIFLDYLDTELIPVPGTAIGEAIETAIRSFPLDRRASRALILITDGEDHRGDLDKAARAAKEKGIRIFTIGIGSEHGAPIPVPGGAGDFKKDRKGQIVMSRMQETALQKIALSTGGSYVRSVSGGMGLRKIYEDRIRGKIKAGERKSMQRRRWEERFQWFLLGGILLICLEAILPDRGRPPTQRTVRPPFLFSKRAVRILFSGIGLLLAAARPAAAESIYAKMRQAETSYGREAYDEALRRFLDAQVERPEDILLKYNIGNTQYRMRNFREAEDAFRGVADGADPGPAQRALYNLGNSAYRQGKLEEAVTHYKQALDLDPDDEDARFNLEFVREEIRRRLNEARERETQEPTDEHGRQQEGETCQALQPQPVPSEPGDEEKEASRGDRQELVQEQGAESEDPPRRPDQTEEYPDRSVESPGPGGVADEMTLEEAERWLNTLDEEQREMARRQVQRALAGRPPSVPDKDW